MERRDAMQRRLRLHRNTHWRSVQAAGCGRHFAAPPNASRQLPGKRPLPPSLPRVAAQLVLIERDTEAGPGGKVDPEIREAQRLLDEVLDQDLRAEMLTAPGEIAQPGEDLQMRRGADRAL